MISPPAVVVHGLEDAEAALRPARPVMLLSARGAALYAGEAWWCALVGAAKAAYPATFAIDALDCADAPGRAMAALRLGQKLLLLDDAVPGFAAVTAAAAACGARLLPARPPSLDLAERGALRRLEAWLAGLPR